VSDVTTTQTAEASDAGELIGLLDEQSRLYRELADLAEHQRSLITGDDQARLLTVLGDRQQLLDRLERLADRLRPYQQHWREVRRTLSGADGGRVDALVSEINTQLSGILAKDKADAELLAARKGSAAKAMGRLKTARQAGAAYAAQADAGGARVEWSSD
jgi:hypothetical protein